MAPKPPAYSIGVKVAVGSRSFKVNLTRSASRIKILYARYDSTANALNQDAELKELIENFLHDSTLTQQERTQKSARIISLYEHYALYSLDSLVLTPKQNRAFFQLADSVYQSSTDYLVNKEKNRIVLDGHSVFVCISGNEQPERSFYVSNPTRGTLIYQLLHESMELYRPKQPNLFPTRRATRGY
ncbi:hypothetical protein PK28_05340 [Hymenobacter sp. DG25B]|uniref:hypothetical protein n=1 Tax=Hymenobacter sp. DG25B TaxID=1385664 RepID=UPI000540F5A6|nr:hypothetical protein [Hymenobacter sp. DG25B]AIZ63258.1 hypothetical protein PK28_05340 [Hymenobacter sp. DG25B]